MNGNAATVLPPGFFPHRVDPILVHLQQAPGTCISVSSQHRLKFTILSCNDGTVLLLQFYYRSTSRELRRLDSVARSPIYSSFTEALDGSATIKKKMTD